MIDPCAPLEQETGPLRAWAARTGGLRMADRPLTLMAVHAHPDDEASSTGGVLAKYSDEGLTTVLVTCTNGELGDSGNIKHGDAGHNVEDVLKLPPEQLEASCKVL